MPWEIATVFSIFLPVEKWGKGIDKPNIIRYTNNCLRSKRANLGGIAQLARACGSYPQCPRFKSRCRYQNPKDGFSVFWGIQLRKRLACGRLGPVVKRLRHRPFTAVTRVRFPSGSPYGGIAQPVERSPHTREVTDSSSVVSTKKLLEPQWFWEFLLPRSTRNRTFLRPADIGACGAVRFRLY